MESMLSSKSPSPGKQEMQSASSQSPGKSSNLGQLSNPGEAGVPTATHDAPVVPIITLPVITASAMQAQAVAHAGKTEIVHNKN